MEYKLLNNCTGVIMTRTPEILNGALLVTFRGATDGMTAIFDNGNTPPIYRSLINSACSIPLHALTGEVMVTIADTSKIPAERWTCEEINVRKLESGEFLICPNDVNLRDAIAVLKLENDDLRRGQAELLKNIDKLNMKLNDIMQGNDLI